MLLRRTADGSRYAKEGATPGATVAFLVATPETGADSISLTYALTDPLMTVFRPIAGVLTAIAAGTLTNFGRDEASSGEGDERSHDDDHAHEHDDPQGQAHELGHPHDYAHDHQHGGPPVLAVKFAGGPAGMVLGAASRIIHYGFRDLFDEVAWWLALGFVLSAVVEVTLPADVFQSVWGGGRCRCC